MKREYVTETSNLFKAIEELHLAYIDMEFEITSMFINESNITFVLKL